MHTRRQAVYRPLLYAEADFFYIFYPHDLDLWPLGFKSIATADTANSQLCAKFSGRRVTNAVSQLKISTRTRPYYAPPLIGGALSDDAV